MAKIPVTLSRIISGIADYSKESVFPDSVAFIRAIDYRSDPKRWTLLPKAQKESGSTVIDLPKWGERVGDNTWIYGDAGNIYKRTLAGVVTLERTVSGSAGNGLKYYGEDDFLYYTTNKAIGRYGKINLSSPTFSDDFLQSEGGVPLNTYSLDLESGSSQYATAADSASLSQTSDITLELNVKAESLPTAGNDMVLMSKWNENSNQRSFRFLISGITGYFGAGTDGSLTISADTTDAPIDSACSGTAGAYTLTATNASFAANQIVLIHQSRGSNAGTWQRNTIVSYTAGTITLQNALNATYINSGNDVAQVLVLKQYTNVTIDADKTLTVKAWNGTVGGILAFIASGTVTVNGTISAKGGNGTTGTGAVSGATGGGFRGGNSDAT